MTRSDCFDPAMGQQVLDGARPNGGPPAPEELAHLAACGRCRTSVERMRRLAGAWRQLEPSRAEVSAVRFRMATRATAGPRSRLTPGAVVAAAVLFAVAASAASRIAAIREGSADQGAERARPTTEDRRPRAVSPAPPDKPLPAPPERPSVGDAIPVEELPVAPSSPQGRVRSLPHTDEKSAQRAVWSEAASAMREGAYERAERAFDVLANAPDASTRDSARLARAELWLARGRPIEARSAFEDLARSAASAFVRKRAAAALQREK